MRRPQLIIWDLAHIIIPQILNYTLISFSFVIHCPIRIAGKSTGSDLRSDIKRDVFISKMKTIFICFPHQLRSEEHTSELQSRGHHVCRLLLEKKKKTK